MENDVKPSIDEAIQAIISLTNSNILHPETSKVLLDALKIGDSPPSVQTPREHSYSSFEVRETQKGRLHDIKIYFDGDAPEAVAEALWRYDALDAELLSRRNRGME